MYWRTPDDPFWDTLLEPSKTDAQATWQLLLVKEPELARHRDMVVTKKWPGQYASLLTHWPKYNYVRQNSASLRQRRQVKPELPLARHEKSEAKGVYQKKLLNRLKHNILWCNQIDTDAQLLTVLSVAPDITRTHGLDAQSDPNLGARPTISYQEK